MFRHAVREIAEHGRDSEWWRGRFLDRVARPYFEWRRQSDDPLIPDADWDALLLLDACRYDLFEETAPELPGELSLRVSHESATPGYIAENFADREFHDIVYVTSNPYVNTELPEDTFHDVVSVWRDGWDDDLGVVPPAAMREATLSAAADYPDKRILAHFSQPHVPFVGDVRLGERRVSSIREEALGRERPDPEDREPTPFERLARGDVDRETVWEAYRSNLEYVLPAVEDLLDALEGRTVVTSDHGNALGEFATPFPIRVYGHPRGIRIPALVRVPWHVYESGSRRQTRADRPAERDSTSVEEVSERLRMLGYRE